MSSLTVIVPTIGRKSLARTLQSFANELTEDDYVLVSCDGWREGVTNLVYGWFDVHYPGQWWVNVNTVQGDWGHPARNHMLEVVKTDLVWTIDDDDEAAPGALTTIRQQTDPFVIYRMRFGPGHPANGITCWREKRMQHGDIGTPMIVAKPCSARFGHHYSGDWDYAQSLQAVYGDPVWNERVIALIRPYEVEDAVS